MNKIKEMKGAVAAQSLVDIPGQTFMFEDASSCMPVAVIDAGSPHVEINLPSPESASLHSPLSTLPRGTLVLQWKNSAIPEELRRLRQWTVFELDWNLEKGKYDKRPSKWRGLAKCGDTGTWRGWNDILAICSTKTEKWPQGATTTIADDKTRTFAPAFALAKDDGLVVIDLDHVVDRDTGEWNAVAAKLLEKFGTYAELSISGDGAHLFCRGTTPLNGNEVIAVDGVELDIEVYSSKRFICMTGEVPIVGCIAASTTITDCSESLKWLESLVVKKCRASSTSNYTPVAVMGPVDLDVPDVDHKEVSVIVDILKAIPATDYDPWWKVGRDMARWGESRMSDANALCPLFDQWSQTAPEKYDADKNFETWGSWVDDAGCNESEFDALTSLKRLARGFGWKESGEVFKNDLPAVVVSASSSTLVTDASELLGREFRKDGRIYCRGREVVEVREKGGRFELWPVTSCRMTSLIEEVAAPCAEKKGEDGEAEVVPCKVPSGLSSSLLACPSLSAQLPEISLVTNCPVLAVDDDGELVEVYGGKFAAGVLAGGEGSVMPSSLTEARECLDFLLGDYRFESEGDRARAVASLITPALVFGGLLDGRAALELTEADQSQTGKSYRNRITAAVYGEQVAIIAQKSGGVGSGSDEAFDAMLMIGRPFISLDNTRGKIDSQKLESFLTEEVYNARAAYSRNTVVDPSRTIVMLTSNRAELTPDLLNRSSIVKILKQEGHAFREFPEGDLLAHIRANSSLYLGAVHYVVREWDKRGRCCPRETRHDFRRWAGVLQAIVRDILGYGDMFEGYAAIRKRMDSPEMTWLRDVLGAVAPRLTLGKGYTTGDLISELLDADPELVPSYIADSDPDVEGMRDKLNRAMGRRLKRAFGSNAEVAVDGRKLVVDNVAVPRDDGKGKRNTRMYRIEAV